MIAHHDNVAKPDDNLISDVERGEWK